MSKIDTEIIREVASPEIVAEMLNLETKPKGRRVSILCPAHDDRHFGSCYLTDNGFKCFACGESGDVIKMVSLIKGYSFIESCEYLASAFGLSLSEAQISDNNKVIKKILKDDILKIINIKKPTPIYKVVEITEEPSDDNKYEWYPYKDTKRYCSTNSTPVLSPDGYFVKYEVIDRNPLQTLANNDYSAYRELILSKAIESKEKYERLKHIVIKNNPASFSEIDDIFLSYYCNKYISSVGYSIKKLFLTQISDWIRICDDLIIEYGSNNSKKTVNKKNNCSVFGKLQGGISF